MREDFRLGEQAAAGFAFVREQLEGVHLTKLAYLKVDVGSPGPQPVYGVCRYPDHRKQACGARAKSRVARMYRISCFAPGPFPGRLVSRQPPLYRRTDGSFPPLQEGQWVRGSTTFGPPPEKAWLSIGQQTVLVDIEEAVVWICGHELFHFLRSTRQVPGRNSEIEADGFADEWLGTFRIHRGSNRLGESRPAVLLAVDEHEREAHPSA